MKYYFKGRVICESTHTPDEELARQVMETRTGKLAKVKGRNAQILGAMGELYVANDLMARGYHVFRNVAVSGCDLVAEKAGKLWRIEVKVSGYRVGKARLALPTLKLKGGELPFDILAGIHLETLEIGYCPALVDGYEGARPLNIRPDVRRLLERVISESPNGTEVNAYREMGAYGPAPERSNPDAT